MPTRPLKTLALLVCAALSALAQAADPPARVGRLSVAQGQVSVAPEFGADPAAAQVNWPVTTGNLVTTAPGARTELRVGSTSIRLDGDSSLEIIELDDAAVRVRLHYGSASIRALNPDALADFTLETPQVRVRLEQPGRVRVDAERVRDTTAVNVFEGVALVEGGGSQLTVRAGRRAEINPNDDVRTLAALRDPFDDWAYQRDRYQDSAASVRYVGTEMTGYEDLDRYGRWTSDTSYGPLWYPAVASTWVPYRDGSWTWVEPWGWTWVDNAPWGYAPFHYGRWMRVHDRWAWAPGRQIERPVWAPALVGWVGGNGWSVAFQDRQRHPALGWYPLSPWDRYEPGYRAPEAHLRWWNNPWHPDHRPRDYRPQGVTVVPQDRFDHHGRVNVPRAPIATVPPVLAHNLPAATPPAPAMSAGFAQRPGQDRPGREWPRHDGQLGRVIDNAQAEAALAASRQAGGWQRGRIETDRASRDGIVRRGPQGVEMIGPAPAQAQPVASAQALPVTSPTPHLPQQPLSTVTSPTPHMGPQPLTGTGPTVQQGVPESQRPGQPGWQGRERWRDRDERDGREQPGEWRRNRVQPQQVQPMQQPQPVQPVQQMQPMQAAQPMQPAQPAPVQGHHGGWERREPPAGFQREAQAQAPRPAMIAPQPQPQPVREVAREMPRPAAPVAMPAPPQPQPAPAAAPAARPAEGHQRNVPRDPRQHDR